MLKLSALLVFILLCMTSQEVLSRPAVDAEKLAGRQYAELLARMDEPQLSDYSGTAHLETYRLIFSEALRDDGPMLVRIEISKDGSSVVCSKWLNERRHLKSRRYTLPPEQTLEFWQGIGQSGFWDRAQEPLHPGLDGSNWTLEGWKNGKYHILEEWSPERRDWMTRLGKQMLSLGHAPIRPSD